MFLDNAFYYNKWRELSVWEVITMMNEVLNATELHFATKKFTAEDMVTMLEGLGWKEN